MQARPIPCFPAGKLTHSGANQLSDSSHSLVDYNRAGIPLLEIVSEPDMRTGQEAAAYDRNMSAALRCGRWVLHSFVLWPRQTAGAGCACHGNAFLAVIPAACLVSGWPPACETLRLNKQGALDRTAACCAL